LTSNFLSVDWGNPHRGTGYKIVDEIKYVMLNSLVKWGNPHYEIGYKIINETKYSMLNFLTENANFIIAILVLGMFIAMMFND
jgi:hypothetical protein